MQIHQHRLTLSRDEISLANCMIFQEDESVAIGRLATKLKMCVQLGDLARLSRHVHCRRAAPLSHTRLLAQLSNESSRYERANVKTCPFRTFCLCGPARGGE